MPFGWLLLDIERLMPIEVTVRATYMAAMNGLYLLLFMCLLFSAMHLRPIVLLPVDLLLQPQFN